MYMVGWVCKVGVGRVYIMQDSGKNTTCALLHTVHMRHLCTVLSTAVYYRVEVCCVLGSCGMFIFKGGNGKLEPIVYWSHQVAQPLRDSHCV